MSEFVKGSNFKKSLKVSSIDSEEQTIKSASSSDAYGDVVLSDTWGSIDAADENQNDEDIIHPEIGNTFSNEVAVDENGPKVEDKIEDDDEEEEEEEDEESDEDEEEAEEDEEVAEDNDNDKNEVVGDEQKGQQKEQQLIHEGKEGESEGGDDDDEEDGEEDEEKSVDKSNVVAEITLATSSEDHTGGDDEAEVDGAEDDEEEEGEEEEGEGVEEEDEEEEVDNDDDDDDEQSSEDDDDINDENFHCDMTLLDIQQEIRELAELAHKGMQFSERRLDYLLKAQEHNPEYRAQQDEENEEWLDSIEDFTVQCLERTRTFIPVNVFSSTQDSLVSMGLSEDLAKRILQRKCLWLVRMSSAEIAGLHHADLYGRFNSTAQHLDIIETAAIYASLPRRFNNDKHGKKREWRKTIEDNLKQMLVLNDNDELPAGKIRNVSYAGLQYGPIKDTESVRENHITSNAGEKEAFKDICRTNSILRDMKEI